MWGAASVKYRAVKDAAFFRSTAEAARMLQMHLGRLVKNRMFFRFRAVFYAQWPVYFSFFLWLDRRCRRMGAWTMPKIFRSARSR